MTGEDGTFISNNIAIGLTLMFLLPQIADTVSTKNNVRSDQVLAMAALIGLGLMNITALEGLYDFSFRYVEYRYCSYIFFIKLNCCVDGFREF
ncbi:MAG: hypothetical protein AAGM67_21235, partial [Bacteroidota bacterium]